MIKVTVAIGEKYHTEAKRLAQCLNNDLVIIDESHPQYEVINPDPLINGLFHKTNFANYLQGEDENQPVLFCDADLFSLIKNPLETFQVNESTDIAFVPYKGKWHFPDAIRQEAFDHFGYKINSGFIYFKSLEIAKAVCTAWAAAYLERVALYGVAPNIYKNEYDEYALMLALKGKGYTIELLDKKWNNWEVSTVEGIQASDSIFFQSHNYIDLSELKT